MNCAQFGIGYSINIVEANTGIVTMADTISRVTNARISRDAEESSEEPAETEEKSEEVSTDSYDISSTAVCCDCIET